MIQKSYYNEGRNCRVTFRYSPDRPVETVHLVSEFDDWDTSKRPMTRRKDGAFSTSLVMPCGQQYRFRYLIDGEKWTNDEQADSYVRNEYGEEDGVVHV